MSRYIDADALKNKLQQHHDFFVKAWGGFAEMPIQDKARCDELSNSIAEIINAPSIETKQIKYFDDDEKVWKIGSIIVEHIAEPQPDCAWK